jgi:5-methylcytosine-specific restriction endonuclease McrA
MYTNAMIKLDTCKNCGIQFPPTRNQKYCSHPCYIEYKHKHPEEFRRVEFVTLTCLACGKVFQRNKQQIRSGRSFCSQKCAGTLTGGIRHLDTIPKSSITKYCEECGKPFKTKGRRYERKYCSRDCFNSNRSKNGWGDNNSNYRHGQNHISAVNTAKRHFDMKCIICGFDIATRVHHIIPISEGGINHPSNLAVLCPNHHAMVHLDLIPKTELQSIVSRLLLDKSEGIPPSP